MAKRQRKVAAKKKTTKKKVVSAEDKNIEQIEKNIKNQQLNEIQEISVVGSNEHNLKNVSINIPHHTLCVVTGLSGSGKSSLAFDTIFVEGQRRYMESLSAYARQFLQMMQKPEVEHISGLPPTIAIEQRKGQSNPRSTVATVTEIYDYLRLLFARAGEPFCYECGKPIARQTIQQIVDNIIQLGKGKRCILYSPIVRGRKGEHRNELQMLAREGYVRARVDGEMVEVRELEALKDKNKKHSLDAVIDRLSLSEDSKGRVTEAVEQAIVLSDGLVIASVEVEKGKFEDTLFSERYGCVDCNISYPELEPRMFSFNSPYGACPECDGLGTKLELDPELIVPDDTKSISDGAVQGWRTGGKRMSIHYYYMLEEYSQKYRVDLDTPFCDLSVREKKILMYGDPANGWEGVVPNLERRFRTTDSEYVKNKIHEYMSVLPCPVCGGARLRKESMSVKISGKSIYDIVCFTVTDAIKFMEGLNLGKEASKIAAPIRKEVIKRLQFMSDVGLDYLTLNRIAGTLSGGEAQRIRLASQVGQGLVGVCYVLDEPTIGLHQRDNDRLLATLQKMRDIGNTVIVVEHDEDVIRAADYLIDVGPGAGVNGGTITACGTVEEVKNNPNSETGRYLSGKESIPIPVQRRKIDVNRNRIKITGANSNNLQNVEASFPLGTFTCVTGVSGSGKSTLITQTFTKALKRELYGSKEKPGHFKKLLGVEKIDKIINIDQSPIGKTPRSNPATYTNVFGEIRKLFSMTSEAKIRGYQPGRFSFNVKGGRCEHCQGAGVMKIEMHFLPDVFVECEHCRGKRYNRETLEIRYKGKNIYDVLNMTIAEAYAFFEPVPSIRNTMQTLVDVGLDYVALGQSSTTLSGGEAQRMKLSSELAKRATGKTLYVLDEPTTGLHFSDIKKLISVLNRLVDMGNTVVVIEHNLDMIKSSDWIIDLGPEGGDRGGNIIATGTPEDVVNIKGSYTGKYLKPYLD